MYGDIAAGIVSAHDASAPLFLYMAFQDNHAPNQCPAEYLDRFPAMTGSRRCYNGMMSAMDGAVGKIAAAVKRDARMYENSVIIFSTDNGGPGEDANNLPLRGAKFGTFEGGVRGAAMVHSPLLPSATRGTVSRALIHLTDWHATFAALAGLSAANTGPVPPDGHDVWPALASGGSIPSPRTSIIHEYDDDSNIYAYRSGDWKVSATTHTFP
jgi:arylsulfatase A-like enzyme